MKSAIFVGWREHFNISARVAEELEKGFKPMAVSFDGIPGHLKDQKIDVLINMSPVIFRPETLSRFDTAINLHTGPPAWPGRGGCTWAILKGDDKYGVTAHLMAEEVDAGSIILVRYFPIGPNDTAETLHRQTINELIFLAMGIVQLDGDYKPKNILHWERPAMKHKTLHRALRLNLVGDSAYCDFPDIGASDVPLHQCVRAFDYPGKPRPFIVRGGYKWTLEKLVES